MKPIRLVWLYTDNPADRLDMATWLNVTQHLRRMGMQVTLVMPGEATQIQGVPVTSVPRSEIYLLRQAIFHLRFLRRFTHGDITGDVILFHQMSAPWFFPWRCWLRLRGKRSPLFVMDTRTLSMAPKQWRLWKEQVRAGFLPLMQKAANRWADGQTAITIRMAEAVKIPKKQLWGIWPSGVECANFAKASEIRHWPQDGEPIRLMYHGVLHYERNLMALSQAVTAANAEGMFFTLTLLGSGNEEEALREYAATSNGVIRVLPPVPHDAVPVALSEAHIGVLPFPDETKFRVSSPIKLFEYMAAGMPVMTTKIVCHTDVVGNGAYAFWVEDGSVPALLAALRQIWSERHHLAKMGSDASNASLSWSWEASANRLKTALEYGLAEKQKLAQRTDKTDSMVNNK